jgi:hypothetical protein
MMVSPLLALVVLSAAACTARLPLDGRALVDLTHSFDEQTIVWPTNRPFTWQKTA